MSDTPKTDAAIALTSQYRYDDSFGDPEFGWVTAGFARTLERELAAERAQLRTVEAFMLSGHRPEGPGDNAQIWLGRGWFDTLAEAADAAHKEAK